MYEPSDVRIGRSLLRTVDRFRGLTIRLDAPLADVVSGCRSNRTHEWMTDRYVRAIEKLHDRGHYQCLSLMSGTTVIGGALGIAWGGMLSLDSMFGEGGAGTACVAAAIILGVSAGAAVDLQWDSPHVRRLVPRPGPRTKFLAHVGSHGLEAPLTLAVPMTEVADRLRSWRQGSP